MRYKNKWARILSPKNEAEILSCVDEMIHQDLNHSVQGVNVDLSAIL